MVGKTIEKAYKYVIPEPNELFQILKEEFLKTTFPDWSSTSNPEWTKLVLGILGGIGRSFGYKPRREYLRLDQTWEIRLPDISTIVLALEHEIADPLEAILDDELQKLLDVKAYLKVLLFYPDAIPMTVENGECSCPEIQEKIRSAKIKKLAKDSSKFACALLTLKETVKNWEIFGSNILQRISA